MDVVAALGGALLAGIISLAVAWQQARSSERLTGLQLRAQAQLAETDRATQIAVELAKSRRARLQEAYRTLMLWLDDIQLGLEKVHAAVYAEDQKMLQDAMVVVDRWPFETLRPPRYTAEWRFLWSDAVSRRLEEVSAASVAWHGVAQQALVAHMTPQTRLTALGSDRAEKWRDHRDPDSEASWRSQGGEVWGKQMHIVSLLQQVRVQIREEEMGD